MMPLPSAFVCARVLPFLVLFLSCLGCGQSSAVHSPESASGTTSATSSSATAAATSTTAAKTRETRAPSSRMEIPSISLGGGSPESSADGTGPGQGQTPEEHRRQLLSAMMPLQVLLGAWHGTTQREIGQFKATDKPSWVWDFQTDRNQPALVMTSTESPYIRSARLTYLTQQDLFQLQAVDVDGQTRILEGTFSEPVQEFQGDDQKMHVKYKLQLTQVSPTESRDQWQIVLNQQENNRYLQEMARKRGSNYLRFDTVATQREGTSFAKSDAGYGEKECIISGGLGTIQLSYKGKSYWVCCTGCKAAFEEDPASWIAEYEKKKKTSNGS